MCHHVATCCSGPCTGLQGLGRWCKKPSNSPPSHHHLVPMHRGQILTPHYDCSKVKVTSLLASLERRNPRSIQFILDVLDTTLPCPATTPPCGESHLGTFDESGSESLYSYLPRCRATVFLLTIGPCTIYKYNDLHQGPSAGLKPWPKSKGLLHVS